MIVEYCKFGNLQKYIESKREGFIREGIIRIYEKVWKFHASRTLPSSNYGIIIDIFGDFFYTFLLIPS